MPTRISYDGMSRLTAAVILKTASLTIISPPPISMTLWETSLRSVVKDCSTVATT